MSYSLKEDDDEENFYRIGRKEEDKRSVLPDTPKFLGDRENLQTKLLEKKPSRFGRQKDANIKEVQEKAQIKNMEIFVQSCERPSPTDFMNWYLSKINTEINPSFSVKDTNSAKAISQSEHIEVGSEHHDLSMDMSCEKLKHSEHYPFFDSVRISTVTWKGTFKGNDIVGETITPETKVNCYLHKYHIVMCIDFSTSMSQIDVNSGQMYFQKMRDVISATLFNLSCSIQKNDKLNKDTFMFEPKIRLTIIG